jgi:hypothetical protein
MEGMRTVSQGDNRVLHAIGVSDENAAYEWLMDETAARGVVSIVAQETKNVMDALYGSLEYPVRLATGVAKKIQLGETGTTVELRVARPCRVVCGIPMNEPEDLLACGMLAMAAAESIDGSMELLEANLSLRACRTKRDLERMVAHARKYGADALVVIMPALAEIEFRRLIERLDAVAQEMNAAVVVVESFGTGAFEELLRRLGRNQCVVLKPR